jgi:hypothetical protein
VVVVKKDVALSVKMEAKIRMAYGSFEDLDVWKRGGRLSVRVYEVLRGCKDFGLKDQMIRAAVSISSKTLKPQSLEPSSKRSHPCSKAYQNP